MNEGNAALIRYNKLVDYKSLEELISEGEAEDLFYECKAPVGPKINHDIKVKLAEIISGYSNTEGGILFYGIETSKNGNSSSDIMIQITKVGAISHFSKKITNSIPTLTMPAITKFDYKVIREKPKDTAGVLVIYIPSNNRPVQSVKDNKFYFRAGDQFVVASYSIIEKLFASTHIPDIKIQLRGYSNQTISGISTHQFNVSLQNDSVAVGKEVNVWMEILNPDNLASIDAGVMSDMSELNDNRKVFSMKVKDVVHYRLGLAVSTIKIAMKSRKHKLIFKFSVYAEGMMPQSYIVINQLDSKSLISQTTEKQD